MATVLPPVNRGLNYFQKQIMAPRRKSFGGCSTPRKPDNFEYLRGVGEFKKTVRRRETLKSIKSGKVSTVLCVFVRKTNPQ